MPQIFCWQESWDSSTFSTSSAGLPNRHKRRPVKMKIGALFRTALVFALLHSFAHAQCIFNSTHCTCSIASVPGLCCRYTSGTPSTGTCVVDDCQVNSRTCDCSGSEICTVNTCDAWKPADPNQVLVLGEAVSCIYAPLGATCVTLPSPSPSTSPSPSISPSTSPSASASPSSTPSPTPTSSPAGGPASATPTPSPTPSPNDLVCPNGSPTLNLHDLFPVGWAFPISNFTFSASYGAGETLTARPLEVESCTGNGVQSVDDYITMGIHPVIPDNPSFPGHCVLQGPNRNSLTYDSHVAMVFQADGFTFQPTELKIWDIDNLDVRDPNNALELIPGVHASETVAVFGARDGNIILPSSSLDPTTALEQLSYTISADSMVDMGLSFPAVVAPGAQQQDANGVNDCDHINDRVTCAITYSFAEPIDTMVVVYGFGEMTWAGDTDAKIFIQNPTVQCPP